jgi:hypothetical protein
MPFIEIDCQRFMRGANNNRQKARGTILGSLAVAQTELPLQEFVRAGRMFVGGTQLAANAIAPDTALPTTTAKLALYNGEPGGGKVYFVDHVHYFLASGTAAIGSTAWLGVSNGPLTTTIPSAMATGYNVAASRGIPSASLAKFGTAITLPAGTVWHSPGGSLQAAGANFGQSDQPFELKGRIAVPPGYALGLAVLSGAGTTPLYGWTLGWFEAESDLE